MAEEEIRDPGTVTFNDVAVYFSSREWDLLAGWQRKLYRNVMKEIHGALAALGYEIANPSILVRVQQEEDPYYNSHDLTDEDYMQDELCSNMKPNSSSDFSDSLPQLPNLKPDILLRVKMEEKITEQGCQTNAQDRKVVSTDSNVPVFNPELSLWIKQEDHLAAAKQSSSTEEENEEELSEAPCEPECTRETLQMTKSSRPRLTTNKRTGLKLRDKILVLCAYQNNESVGSLAAQFGVSRSQIVQIIKRRDELISALENNVSGDRIRRRRRTTNDQLNSAVWEWLLSTQDTDIILSGRIIRDKALQIASEMGIRDFKASNGWLDSFKKAHNIHQRSVPIFGAGFGDEKIDEWMAQMRNLDDR